MVTRARGEPGIDALKPPSASVVPVIDLPAATISNGRER